MLSIRSFPRPYKSIILDASDETAPSHKRANAPTVPNLAADLYARYGQPVGTDYAKHLALSELPEEAFAQHVAPAATEQHDPKDETEKLQREYDRVTQQLDRAHSAHRPRPTYISILMEQQEELRAELEAARKAVQA